MKRVSQFDHNRLTDAGISVEKGITEKDVDSDELALGIQVEKEHTDSDEIAKKIALDHLAEFKNYYSELKKMEERLKKQKSAVHAYYRFLLKGNR